MSPIKIITTVGPDGTLTVDQLPFAPGDRVEVTVSPWPGDDPTEGGKYPLRGRGPYKYDDPFGPACDPDDWEANR
jgi:hypothetical protein